mmetsp:Transcript_95908/g.248309  ORF Transcript_95908/g.248309 Transcript_95908/m.248309 type:complete len:203 (+) Transcript_95908:304-912(+)
MLGWIWLEFPTLEGVPSLRQRPARSILLSNAADNEPRCKLRKRRVRRPAKQSTWPTVCRRLGFGVQSKVGLHSEGGSECLLLAMHLMKCASHASLPSSEVNLGTCSGHESSAPCCSGAAEAKKAQPSAGTALPFSLDLVGASAWGSSEEAETARSRDNFVPKLVSVLPGTPSARAGAVPTAPEGERVEHDSTSMPLRPAPSA